MRRSALVLLLALAACRQAERHAAAPARAKGAAIGCALGGTPAFRSACTVERETRDGRLTLILHHPDGGFRRLLVTTDGRGVVTADGAQEAAVSVVDPATIEVSVDGDRYRLPATIRGG